ncbi:uncharacterized protein LOC143359832 [Halictus rubicundus]|uniref:uncharacterized protein LOC143359832 n=1 Tax=Halictus rubicundus TaxID=77578 RepID=UPI00403507A1
MVAGATFKGENNQVAIVSMKADWTVTLSKLARTGRKEQTALQTEVDTEQEWEQLLNRKGLVLADIYSEWCGPCIAMVSTLRKIKMEVGGDTISYAIVKNDNIEDIKRFRGKSEPVWMFIQDGKMVNLIFGANCPNLRKALVQEIRRVQANEEPEMKLSVSTRTPEEEVMWQKEEAIRKAKVDQRLAKEEAERKEKYEAFLAQMMFELCEETALVFYPWIFRDEEGRYRDKYGSPPYTDLTTCLFKQNFDIQEEQRLSFTEEMIESMLVESGDEMTPEMIAGFTDGKTLALRLKGRRPHPDWPVPYPYDCPKGEARCPTREIHDVENYLVQLLTSSKPLIHESVENINPPEPYMERHIYVHEPDPEDEEDFPRQHPAVWIPPQARSKVHVFNTIFSNYMERVHPYEEPLPPAPFCAFKFRADKFDAVYDTCALFPDALRYFGAFEFDKPPYAGRIASSPEDFQQKVKYKTGAEVFVVIIQRITDDVFLSFASIEPYFVTEVDEEAYAMINEYFPEGAEDVVFDLYADIRDDDDQDYEDEEEGEEEVEDVEEVEDSQFAGAYSFT